MAACQPEKRAATAREALRLQQHWPFICCSQRRIQVLLDMGCAAQSASAPQSKNWTINLRRLHSAFAQTRLPAGLTSAHAARWFCESHERNAALACVTDQRHMGKLPGPGGACRHKPNAAAPLTLDSPHDMTQLDRYMDHIVPLQPTPTSGNGCILRPGAEQPCS